MPLLDVQDLTVRLATRRGSAAAVVAASFAIEPGGTVGLIGESGSGKTMTALAIDRLLPEDAEVSGRILFKGEDLAQASEQRLCALRGNRIGMVFQEPMTALNPLQTIGRQVAEPLIEHLGRGMREAGDAAVGLLDRVGLPDPARRAAFYPHQLSGGQRQRVMLAMALACGPDLLIADEPTTALDIVSRQRILALITALVSAGNMALLLVSHDLGVVARNVARTLVMYAGTIVESGPTQALIARPAHPYTRALLAARPRLGAGRGGPLPTVPGSIPDLAERPQGCRFAGRCPLTIAACRAALPPFVEVGPGHAARCIRLDAALNMPDGRP